MEIIDNSDAALVSLFLSFAYIDGELHPTEVQVINQACKELEIDTDLVATVLREHGIPEGDFISSCKQAMSRITDEDLQNRALITLCDIAAADDVFDKNEQVFLTLAAERWQVEASSHADEFAWDEHQRQVVEAPAAARLEVHAGPGMGKTAVACARVSRLIEAGVEPTNIWLLSFTRTAVQEIRNRIELFAEDSHSILGVKIGTLDSRAWRVRCGFSEGEVKKLFGSYDANIQDVIDLVEENPHDIREFMESLEHVIIDEAQDIVGNRARLIALMLGLLSEGCGVTVFADPAQAIYGFTTDGENVAEEDRINLLGLMKEELGSDFVEHELQTIHRTDVPNLIELMEELRLDIYVNENIDVERFKIRHEIVVDKANDRLGQFDAKELAKYQNALVLFRRRAEVLQASSFANSYGIKHRIRMSGLPSVVQQWLGQLLSNYTKETIEKEEFAKRWNGQDYFLLDEGIDVEDAWSLLFGLGQKKGVVHISEIRKKLARTPPDISVTKPDLGSSGPIIGTIHASKGREADEVILRLPDVENLRDDDELDEESRVMFVGASRARSKLYVGSGFVRAAFASSLESGRCFSRTKRVGKSKLPAAQVEIGRENDVDPYSFVSKTNHTQARATEIQRWLAQASKNSPVSLDAHWGPNNDFNYQIWTKYDGTVVGKPIGYFNFSLNDDLFKIRNRICDSANRHRLPNSIPHLYLIGVSCFAATEDDLGIKEVNEPYASTGIWLVPLVFGYPRIVFPPMSRRSL